MAEFKISGRTTVKGLKAQFLAQYGLSLRVFNGSIFAKDDATLASLSIKKNKKVDEFTVRSNMLVGNFEVNFEAATGVKVQVASGDNLHLVDNKATLSEARKAFAKK